MALREDIPKLLEYVKSSAPLLAHNAELFTIYEGDLIQSVLRDLKAQLSAQSFDQIQHRVAPINVLIRLIDKLSKIYSEPPARWLEIESDKDQDLFNEYLAWSDFNNAMQLANEFFNLFKTVAIRPYVIDGKPNLRIIPSDRFVVWSNNKIDPTIPTHYIEFMGLMEIMNPAGNKEMTQVFYVYTDTEFLPVNGKGEVIQSILLEMNNPGINPIGRLPIVYSSRSKVNLVPPPDSDTLRMTKIFPVLLSDLNFAVMYQAFSIVYGIDVDDQDIVMSPNAFWRFKSDPTTQSKPQIGVVKPQVDIQQVIGFILAQLSFWLQTRNIRPGTVGALNAENFASGVSKIVDEMDTYEERKKQIPYFNKIEREIWDLVMHGYHPYWVREGLIDESRVFEPGQRVTTEFPPQRPMMNRLEVLNECEKELSLRLTTRRDCIMKLNPLMNEEEVDELMGLIDQEGTIEIPGDSTAIAQGDHVHSTPKGDTGSMIVDETGHYHQSPLGQTNSEQNSPGHVHQLYDGTQTGQSEAIQVNNAQAQA